jgi:hypothetical protein
MRSVFILLVSFGLIIPHVYGQSPDQFSYQAVVRDGDNNLITNQEVGKRISIIQGDIDDPAIYVELHQVVSNSNGLVTLAIGAGDVELGDFSEIDWAEGPFYLGIETDLDGGTNYTISSTTELLSVPFALHATTAERLLGAPPTPGDESPFYLGQDTLGGIVFEIYDDRDGNEVAMLISIDRFEGAWQEDPFEFVGANSTWNGQFNTDSMSNSPIKDWVESNFSEEWYIPSIEELDVFWGTKFFVNRGLFENGHTEIPMNESLWSSTERTLTTAMVYFFSGEPVESTKSTSVFFVRPIRKLHAN